MLMEGKGRKWLGRKSLDHGPLSHHQVPSWKRLLSSIQTAAGSGEELLVHLSNSASQGPLLYQFAEACLSCCFYVNIIICLCEICLFSPLPCDECQLFEGFAIPQMLQINQPSASVINCVGGSDQQGRFRETKHVNNFQNTVQLACAEICIVLYSWECFHLMALITATCCPELRFKKCYQCSWDSCKLNFCRLYWGFALLIYICGGPCGLHCQRCLLTQFMFFEVIVIN